MQLVPREPDRRGGRPARDPCGRLVGSLALALWGALALSGPAAAAGKPNIVVIWGDDIGVHNISAYNHGIMGYKTPNIDRIAKEGYRIAHPGERFPLGPGAGRPRRE